MMKDGIMKALVTGSEGFAGKYLVNELITNGYSVVGADLSETAITRYVDLLDTIQTKKIIDEEKPDCIFHLVALADVGKSWKNPQLTVELNVVAAINVLEAVRQTMGNKTRIVVIGSSDQYGKLGNNGLSVTEDMDMKPVTPYAIAKRAQEEISRLYANNYGLQICMTRSFNHGGAGQKTGFLIPDFANGIVKVERGDQRELLVGNLAARRDFTHIKDIVRAYRLIAEKGVSGEVYNVGSGQTHSVQEILNLMKERALCEIPVRQDPSRMRPSDTPVVCCNHDKLTHATGWEPQYSLSDILEDTLTYYRSID